MTALKNFVDIMDKIQAELNALKESMDYHGTKYLSYWRTNMDSPVFLKQLKLYKKIFIERKDLLMQIVSLHV